VVGRADQPGAGGAPKDSQSAVGANGVGASDVADTSNGANANAGAPSDANAPMGPPPLTAAQFQLFNRHKMTVCQLVAPYCTLH